MTYVQVNCARWIINMQARLEQQQMKDEKMNQDSTTIQTPAGEIRVGSVIRYASRNGAELSDMVVTGVYNDVKNGYPGFDGELPNGDAFWGYEEQCVRIIHF